MSYDQQIVDTVKMPPRDASCEMKEGAGFNIGYERGHGQAKVEARAIARRADAQIKELESFNSRLIQEADKDCGIMSNMRIRLANCRRRLRAS